MAHVILITITLITLAAAAYAHWSLPAHTPNHRQLRTARMVLIATGIALGWVLGRIYGAATELNGVLVFLATVGLVHVPAAAILFTKSWSVDE